MNFIKSTANYMKNHLVIVRTCANVLDINTYNCQELGLAKALLKKGLCVSLVLAGLESKILNVRTDFGTIGVHYLRFHSLDQRFGCFIGLDKKLQELKPAYIQVHDFGTFMTFEATKWAKKNKVPCFLIQGTYQLSPRPIIRQLEFLFCKTFGKYTLKNVTGIGCKTQMSSRFISDYINRSTLQTNIGLDESKFERSVRKDWRKKLNLDNKHILLYVGIMEERRRPHFLVDIIKLLPKEYVLILVGNGPQLVEIESRVEKENLQGRVFLLGKLRQEELPALYEQSDLFLLASEYEIYGMVLLESMYFGLPVLSSFTAGSETLIDCGRDSFIVNDFDVNRWRNEIVTIFSDGQKLKSIKQLARFKIKNQYIWDKAADTFINLYKL